MIWVDDSPDVRVQDLAEDVREGLGRLGGVLVDHADELVGGVTCRAHRSRAREGAGDLDPGVEESFVRLGRLATVAVARWLSGGPVDVASAAGEEFSRVFAQLAASSDVPLGEVVRRCQYWRDACFLALRGAGNDAGEQALGHALRLTGIAADRTVAQMSQIFDEERRRVKEQLAFLATHDSLTGLANRALITDVLERMLARSARGGGGVAVLFVDLDEFKLVNDTFGHRVGDELLVVVADRLRAVVRDADALGRMGGDEFIVLADEREGSNGSARLARRVLDVFSEPFVLEGCPASVRVSASVGVAVARAGSSAEQLLCDADTAMYQSKAQRNT